MTNPPERHDVYPNPAAYYEPVFYPVASSEGTPSRSPVGPRTTPKVNSVIVVRGHDENEGTEKMRWSEKNIFFRIRRGSD